MAAKVCLDLDTLLAICRAVGGDPDLFREKLVEPTPSENSAKNSVERTALCDVSAKNSVVRKVLHDVNIIGDVRFDDASGNISVLDVVRIMLGCTSSVATTVLRRIFKVDDCVPSIETRIRSIRINQKGKFTPAADLKTVVEVIWKVPGRASAKFRRKSAETICRVMGGDLDLVRDIEQNHLAWSSTDGGEVIQRALLKPVEYRQEETSHRVKESIVRDRLASIVGGETEVPTQSGFIDVLSDTDVIEVKHYRLWKQGFGQVVMYQSHYPLLAKRLHLFAHTGDNDVCKMVAYAKSKCAVYAVEVTFEEV